MVESDKILMLQSITEETNAQILSIYLDMAKDAILTRLYPFGVPSEIDGLPEEYDMRQVNIAAFLLNKRGAEGEVGHKENGVDRSYNVNGIPLSFLSGIVPYTRTPSQEV